MLSPIVTLAQIYFSNDRRDDPLGDAQLILEEVREHKPDPGLFDEIGDQISLPTYFEESDRTHLLRMMGDQFTDVVMQCETPGWLGSPVESGYGIHIVYVFEIIPARTKEFEEVSQEVLQDFKYMLSQEYNASMFKSLVKKYDVVLDFVEYASLQNKLSVESEKQK